MKKFIVVIACQIFSIFIIIIINLKVIFTTLFRCKLLRPFFSFFFFSLPRLSHLIKHNFIKLSYIDGLLYYLWLLVLHFVFCSLSNFCLICLILDLLVYFHFQDVLFSSINLADWRSKTRGVHKYFIFYYLLQKQCLITNFCYVLD